MPAKPPIDTSPIVLHEPINYSGIPEHCREGVQGYIERGEEVVDFLTAIFSNDLVGAFGRADGTNLLAIQDYAAFLWNEAPTPAWGSRQKMDAWQERGGVAGRCASPSRRRAA